MLRCPPAEGSGWGWVDLSLYPPRAFPSRIRIVNFFLVPGKAEVLDFLLCVSGVLLVDFFSGLYFPESQNH